MNKKTAFATLLPKMTYLVCLVSSSIYPLSKGYCADNYASTTWVQQQINLPVSLLQAQINGLQGQINGFHYLPGEGILIKNKTISSAAIHQIGEIYQGGIVFFVDKTGLHGLIAATEDVKSGSWKNWEAGEKIINAKGNGVFSGESNTRLIVAEQTQDYQPGEFAALNASKYTADETGKRGACSEGSLTPSSCYGGWYLPSILSFIYCIVI